MIVLVGILIVVAGFATRRNPLLVVGAAGIVTGLLGGLSPVKVLETFGTGFASSRSVTLFAVTLPVIGLLERHGLQEQARTLMNRLAKVSAGRLLACYLVIRQLGAALGLTALGGHPQAVRPMIAPMAEAAVERRHGTLTEKARERLRSFAASADNVGLFFGEDCFLAVGSILLITGFVNATYHTSLEPVQLALWAVPTAVCATLVHGLRLLRLDTVLARDLATASGRPADAPAGARTAAATLTAEDSK
ncbi:DUF969 domain-containing protein [Streptomyces rubellomurinus]|uniref:Membrane protein n=1 Tax=Streptomyces rubellomurinus (strain ATCC 31215) TaxID=359131 RepID=A0A0F2TL14_STRR3|nr:DUF969 domain-containing protein [Streptomyces rubellomurinus]KJS63849.1 membrane protein [Streptomyces rubellomurinus]